LASSVGEGAEGGSAGGRLPRSSSSNGRPAAAAGPAAAGSRPPSATWTEASAVRL
jgi:hypothetical protein